MSGWGGGKRGEIHDSVGSGFVDAGEGVGGGVTEEEENGPEHERQTLHDQDRIARRPFCSFCARPLVAMKVGKTVEGEAAYSQSTPR